MLGSCDRFQRSVAVLASEVVRGLLSRVENTSFAGEGRSRAALCAEAGAWTNCCDTASWRSSLPVRAARRLMRLRSNSQSGRCVQRNDIDLVIKRA
jgi:hypothetical protein